MGSTAQTVNRFDIVMDELMADPSPAIGLPNSEFIELKNNAAFPVALKNWKISDGASTATISQDLVLQPDSFVIVCPNAAVAEFSRWGNTIGVSNFPSLNNDGDLLVLYSAEGKIIHAIAYSNTWYQNDVKRDGGWSLEMIDTRNACSGIHNWKASLDAAGGTPGRKNSIAANNPDEMPPALLRTYAIDSNTVVAVFDESLDSAVAAVAANYILDNNFGQPLSAIPVPPLYEEVILRFPNALSPNTVYQLTVSHLPDCAGNMIGALNKVAVGLPLAVGVLDIVINEILFNPAPSGYDYIEFYNRSNKTIDLKSLYTGNVNGMGNFTNLRVLADKSILFFPGTYLVVTENAEWLQRHYLVKDKNAIVVSPLLPSMPDDAEHIALINTNGNIIDDLHYDKKWHFALIDQEEGVSLERINYNDSTQNKNNWTSAAATAGFGTPGYQNSQFRADLFAQSQVTVSPKILSPDNSGADDFASIFCRQPEPGYVANITIYDEWGRPVRRLVRNATMGSSAVFHWDGLDDQQKKLPIGHYIILTEIFNLQGKTGKFKNVVTLARRL
jgi:hypothetical protein